MTLAKVLQTSGFTPTAPKSRGPLWKGPEDGGPHGGVTQSLISLWMTCRERARIKLIEGLQPPDTFSHRMEYGTMMHLAIERWSGAVKGRDYKDEASRMRHALSGVTEYAKQLCRRHPTSQESISHWHEVCKVQFPVYVAFWAKHHDDEQHTPLLQEQTFKVPYRLPSGRTVYLRGKWDGVEHIRGKNEQGVWLIEHKTKGDIREGQIQRQLTFDMQTMLYMTALTQWKVPKVGKVRVDVVEDRTGDVDAEWVHKPEWVNALGGKYPVLGVRYDVIRRPLSGGKGSIVRHKATKNHPEETKEHFYGRVKGYIEESPQDYFMRWRVDVRPSDIERFRQRCLDPILECLTDWYQHVTTSKNVFGGYRLNPDCPGDATGYDTFLHWIHPFNAFGNPLDDGGTTEYDEYITSGNDVGLVRADCLFTELEEQI